MTADPPGLLDPLFSDEAVRLLFADTARLQGMLDFEAALASAEATAGVIPKEAAETIAEHCRADLFDRDRLAADAAIAGNVAIPLVAALTRIVSQRNPDAGRWVHWGATSQDVIDTGLVLQMRRAVETLLPRVDELSDALAELARAHASTPIVGRTWLQHAVPITFGLKAAGWCAAADRARAHLSRAGRAASVLQFGGAAGSLAALGERGPAVTAALAARLNLDVPELPWHTHRDRLVDLGASLGLLMGVLGKIGRDVSLLMQSELEEVAEPAAPGRGGSSAMPHKRNPVACAVMLAAATRAPGLVATLFAAMPQEHERGLGGWHAEWETLPELFLLASGAARHAVEAIRGLEVAPDRMRTNIDVTRGLIMAEAVTMALAPNVGRQEAHQIVEEASRSARSEQVHLRDVLARHPLVSRHLTPQALDRLFTTDAHAAEAARLVARMLDARRAARIH